MTFEVGDRLAPAPGRFFVAVSTDYLDGVPVAGGFRDFGEALWVYGLVIDHVAKRLEYLEEDLFNGLYIEIEEWEPREVDSVWISVGMS